MRRISQGEIEAMITANIRGHHPGLGPIRLFRTRYGWRCRITRVGRSAAPFPEADRLLSDLLKNHTIVDEDGCEDDGKI